MTMPAGKPRKPHKGSPHFNVRHPAVAAVICPVCQAAPGNPCRVTARSVFVGQRTEPHVGRIRYYERTTVHLEFAGE